VIHPAYAARKALQMRVEKDLTIDEIAERLAVSRQTILHWVRDLPLKKPRRVATLAQAHRNRPTRSASKPFATRHMRRVGSSSTPEHRADLS
jgi:DNA-binding XRE family transcriptional regulator